MEWIVYSICHPYNKEQVIHEEHFSGKGAKTQAYSFAKKLEDDLGRVTLVVGRKV